MKKFTKAGAKFAAAAAVSVMALGYTTSVWADENTVVKIGKEFADIKGTQTVSLPSIYFSSEKADNVKGIGLDIHNVEKLNIINSDEGGLFIGGRANAYKKSEGIGINVKDAQADFDINGDLVVMANGVIGDPEENEQSQGVVKGAEKDVSMKAVGFYGENGSSQIKAKSVYYEASNQYYRRDSTGNRETPTGTLVEESLGMALNNYATNIFAEKDINIYSFILNNTELTGEKTAQGMVLSNGSKASLQAGGQISIEVDSTSNSKLEAINAKDSKLDMKAEQGIKIIAANGDAIVADKSEVALDGGSSVISIRGNVDVLNNSTLKLSGMTSIGGSLMRIGMPGSNLTVDNSTLVVDGIVKTLGETKLNNAKIYMYDANNAEDRFHALSIKNLDIAGSNELFLRADSSKAAGNIGRFELNSDVIGISGNITGEGKFDVNVFDKGMKNGYGLSADGTNALANPITVLHNPYSTIDIVSLINSKKVKINDMHYDNGIWSYDYEMNAVADGNKIVIKEVDVTAAPSASGSQRSLHSANKAAGALAIGVLGNDSALHAHLREVREHKDNENVWAQYLGGKLKSDGIQLKHNGVELGYDAYVGNNWTFGVSGMQTRGNTQLDSGSGKLKTNVGTLYGAWHGDGGEYMNLEAKAGRISSESKARAVTGGEVVGYTLQKLDNDFSASAYSLSAEYGRTRCLADNWFIEPALRLSYVHMGASDYGVKLIDTSARVTNDSFDSFVVRGGAKLGRNLGDKGCFYVKAAAVYDFAGDVVTTLVDKNGRVARYEDSLGGWGVEYGAGVDYRLSKATNVSFDVERRSGGDLRRDWGVNVGVNYSF